MKRKIVDGYPERCFLIESHSVRKAFMPATHCHSVGNESIQSGNLVQSKQDDMRLFGVDPSRMNVCDDLLCFLTALAYLDAHPWVRRIAHPADKA